MGMTLPDAPWRTRPGLDRLATILGGHEGASRFVGGAVRDTLLGLMPADPADFDIDVATTLPPQEVLERLQDARIKAVPTGLAHGTITAVTEGGTVEITTLRRDVATDGRHATIAYTDDWREDAARRDFTINALYADTASGEIVDYFGGLDDLSAGRVRFIGDPLQRIAEDHLRILRFFRFHARFGSEIDTAGLDACTLRANDLMALSRERIAAEMLKLLVAARAVPVIGLMVERGILRAVLPEIDADGVARLSALVDREATSKIAPDPFRRLAALVPARDGDGVVARLKLSNTNRKRVVAATEGEGAEGPRALAYRHGVPGAIDRLLIAGADVAPIMGWSPPAFPLNGGALVERGLRKGPDVAAVRRQIETQWIAEDFPDQARVDAIADAAVKRALG